MSPRVSLLSLLTCALATGSAHSQVAMKMGDLILFDAYADAPVSFYSRDNGTQTALVPNAPQANGSALFQLDGEIDQAPDGSIIAADLPSSHVVKLDGHYGANDKRAVTVYDPTAGTFTVQNDNLAVGSDGNPLRVGTSGTQGALLKHHLDTGVLETITSGNLLTGDAAAAGIAIDGSVIVAQSGATANLVLVSGTTQTALGSSATLNGAVYDVEALPDSRVAIATGVNGVVLATYVYNAVTAKYSTTFQSLGNYGGSVQWVKTDTDGNLLFSVYFTPSSSKIFKYDLPTGRVDTVLSVSHLTSFAVVKTPTTLPGAQVASGLSTTGNGPQISFSGLLQSSTDLANWTTLDPQPLSPYVPATAKAAEFFRVSPLDPHPITGKILFRGNSYTNGFEVTNNVAVPTMVSALSSSLGYTFTTDLYAQLGIGFKEHYNDPASLAKVQLGGWTNAVLQNLSTGPTTSPTLGNLSDHFYYGRQLYLQQVTQDPKVHVFLYETPAYRADSSVYTTDYGTPAVFQSQLTTNYRLLARNLNQEFPNNVPVTVVPTGELVQAAGGLLPVTNRFYVPMHNTDGQHPNDNRAALTGLAFFVALTHQNPDGLLSTPGVTALGLNITADPRWLEKLVWRYMTTGGYPIVYLTDPLSQTANVGQAVNLSVNVQGSGPVTYQWYKNDAAIAGATLKTYSTIGTTDASTTYYCIATNTEGPVKSAVAVVSAANEAAGLKALVDFSDPGTGGADTTLGAAPNDPVNHWNTWKAITDANMVGLPSTLALVRPDGTASGITLQSVSVAAGSGAFGPSSGGPYAGNATVDFWYGNSNSPLIDFKATGLASNRTYKLTFYGSRVDNASALDNRQTNYTVAGASATPSTVSLDARNNVSNTVSVTGVAPDATGTLDIKVTKGAANTNTSGFFYLNTMSIELE